MNALMEQINDLDFSASVLEKVRDSGDMDLMASLSPSLIQSLGEEKFIGQTFEYVKNPKALRLVKKINRPEFTQHVREWALGLEYFDLVAAFDKAFPATGG